MTHSVRYSMLPIATLQLICVMIAPDCLLSPVSLAKICSIFIFPNDQFV